MKNTILKSVLALVMILMSLPMLGQDYMKIYFKDGTFRKIYLKNVDEITVSKLDANGISHGGYEYQRITCPQNDYVYSLQDVDSITFTKYNEEKVKEYFDTAMPKVFALFSKCKDISDVESMIDSFKNIKGVERVWIEGSKLYVKIPEWEPMPFHFEYNDTSSTKELARTLLPAFSSTVKKDGEKLKAVIANQRGFNFEKLARDFRNCNIDVNYDSDKEPTLDFFLSGIYKYDLVFLFTHGAYLNGKHWLLTSHRLTDDLRWENNVSEEMMNNLEEILNKEEYKDKQFTLGQDIDIHFSSGLLQNLYAYISISEDCIKEKSVGKFPNNNSILFNGACESLIYGNSLAEIYLGDERGLGVYFGYDSDNFGSKTAGTQYFTSLLEGKSVTKSYYDIPEKYRDESGMINPVASWVSKAQLLPVTHKSQEVCDNLFLFPTYTNKISQDEANEQYTNSSYVQIEGITRTLNPDAVELGFVYGTGENFTVDHYVTDVELNYLGASNNTGNYLFKGKLTDLEPSKTYFYRAYTYDGTNYNYGNPESFTIYKKLTLATNTITLSALTCGSVQITSGSGSYVIESSDEFIATAFIDGDIISVNALNPGDATITVSDKVSGQTATIAVTVTGQADTRKLMVTRTVNKTVYSIYKKTLDEDDYRTNPDGWTCYRSELVLDIIKDGKTESHVIDDNIYLDDQYDHHVGQHPCMLLDFNKNIIGIFCNSKESGSNYAMDGYYYSSPMSNISFSKETIFEGNNWGWFPYFRDYKDGSINLIHFSYNGYFTIRTTNSDGSWKHYYDNKDISPEAAQQIWDRIGSVLVIGNTQDDDVDDRINTVIPEEIRDEIDEYIPIYDGMNPPNIEGAYFMSPQILIGSSLSYDQIGKVYNSEYQKYGKQDMEKNTIDMIRVQGGGTSWSKGSGAFISGTGNNFTIYFEMTGESSYTSESGAQIVVPTKTTYIVSGTKTSSGIKNLTCGFIMKEKGYDPDERIVDVGTFRFFTDQDGMSDETSWPYNGQFETRKLVKERSVLPNSLERCDKALIPLK